MIRVAIVEDQKLYSDELINCLKKYGSEINQEFVADVFTDGLCFLDGYNSDYDIVFMDIELPNISGLETARRLRERDDTVILIFVTVMAQFAIEGYSVGALDYILKPVSYFSFALKMSRTMKYIDANLTEDTIFLKTGKKTVKVRIRDIMYIEVNDHYLKYCTRDGEYEVLGTLAEAEDLLPANFCRASRYLLLNFRYITAIDGADVEINGKRFTLSRGRKKPFINQFAVYSVGGGV